MVSHLPAESTFSGSGGSPPNQAPIGLGASRDPIKLTTQRKHSVRTWMPLFYWLLDVTLTNCFILWRLQARREDPKIDWDPIEFNRALGSALLLYDPTGESSLTSMRSIPPNRCRGVLRGIPIRVEAVTDLTSVLLARGHDMRKEGSRRECIGCKIDGKVSGEGRGGRQLNIEYAKTVNTMCKQCNVYLCRKGKCWERYHNSRRY
jgi:hypothetical protein